MFFLEKNRLAAAKAVFALFWANTTGIKICFFYLNSLVISSSDIVVRITRPSGV